MEIISTVANGKVPVTILRLQGNFDAASAEDFDAAAHKALQAGAKDILVDMSGVPFMSSAGMRSLHSLYNTLHPPASEDEKKQIFAGISAGTYKAPHLKLLNPNARVTEALKLAGMDMYIPSFTSEQAALAAFG
jgi:anti-anti-sigma regulatory factor